MISHKVIYLAIAFFHIDLEPFDLGSLLTLEIEITPCICLLYYQRERERERERERYYLLAIAVFGDREEVEGG